jgi:hypothetical protein
LTISLLNGYKAVLSSAFIRKKENGPKRSPPDIFEQFDCLVLIVISLQFMKKHFRRQDTKTRRRILTKDFPLCLGAFVAICSGLSGLGNCKFGDNLGRLSWLN